MNSDNIQHKKCFGWNCSNHARNVLKVKYIQRIGYFCDICTSDLLGCELAEMLSEGEIYDQC